MEVKHITVNGKTLSGFDKNDGTRVRSTARQLLARPEVDHVEEGGRADLVVWLRETNLHWSPPRGWEITEVSFFGTDEYRNPSVLISITEVED